MIQYYRGQSRAVADIFHRAIHQTASAAYTPEQIQAWAPLPINYDYWRARCELKRPFLWVDEDGTVGGFLELDSDGHIDCHYTHPDFNRRGIGSALLRHAIQIATELALPRLYVEASHLAKGLYLKHGFAVVRANEVTRNGATLQNWIMERRTAGQPPAGEPA